MSVATARPVWKLPLYWMPMLTSPSASVPPVTAPTLNEMRRASRPTVRQVAEARPGPVEVVTGQFVAQVGQGLGEGVAAGVLAEHDAVGLPADGGGVHDLVGRALHQDAVRVDAGLVGEGVGADDCLV